MTTTQIIIIGVAVAIVIAVAISRNSGPRVTQIDRTVRREKDRDDA